MRTTETGETGEMSLLAPTIVEVSMSSGTPQSKAPVGRAAWPCTAAGRRVGQAKRAWRLAPARRNDCRLSVTG
jgi:hypothetical protein